MWQGGSCRGRAAQVQALGVVPGPDCPDPEAQLPQLSRSVLCLQLYYRSDSSEFGVVRDRQEPKPGTAIAAARGPAEHPPPQYVVYTYPTPRGVVRADATPSVICTPGLC